MESEVLGRPDPQHSTSTPGRSHMVARLTTASILVPVWLGPSLVVLREAEEPRRLPALYSQGSAQESCREQLVSWLFAEKSSSRPGEGPGVVTRNRGVLLGLGSGLCTADKAHLESPGWCCSDAWTGCSGVRAAQARCLDRPATYRGESPDLLACESSGDTLKSAH